MKGRGPAGIARIALLLGAGLLAACASDDPYSAADYSPSSQGTRQPAVAPAGPLSPWWWPAPDSWWPF